MGKEGERERERDPKAWGRTRRPERPMESEAWWRRNRVRYVRSEESEEAEEEGFKESWTSRRRGSCAAAIGSSKMSSPTTRSAGSRRRGMGSTWNEGLHSLITRKAREWGPP